MPKLVIWAWYNFIMAFSLGDIARQFRSAFKGKAEGSVLGIDIGASSAKIVQLRAAR